MRKLTATTALLLMVPALASAQSADHQYRAQGYFFLAPAATNFVAMSAGFGGEAFVYRGLGLGAKVGLVSNSWRLHNAEIIGLGSANVSYHFFPKRNHSKVEPFAAGGYSLFTTAPSKASGFNVGGGVNLWVRKRAALRLEVRDQAHAWYSLPWLSHVYLLPGVDNFVTFRFGLTLR